MDVQKEESDMKKLNLHQLNKGAKSSVINCLLESVEVRR